MYHPRSRWTHEARRALIADSPRHILQAPGTPPSPSTTTTWFPFNAGAAGFFVDGARHGPPQLARIRGNEAGEELRTKKLQTYAQYKALNMLFCDGHAASVSVREAWNSIHNPGSNMATD